MEQTNDGDVVCGEPADEIVCETAHYDTEDGVPVAIETTEVGTTDGDAEPVSQGEADKPPDNGDGDEPDHFEPILPPVDEKGESQESGASEKYDSAVEEMETDPRETNGGQDAPPPNNRLAEETTREEESGPRPGPGPVEIEDNVGADDTVLNASHLQDIEMKDVDESQLKLEDTTDGEQSFDQAGVRDPFDQIRQERSPSNGEAEQAIVDREKNGQGKGQTEDDGDKERGDANVAAAGDGGPPEGDANVTGEARGKESPEESGGPGGGGGAGEQLGDFSAGVDDLTGGENENICLLPDDERIVSEEDKQRAITEDEAEDESSMGKEAEQAVVALDETDPTAVDSSANDETVRPEPIDGPEHPVSERDDEVPSNDSVTESTGDDASPRENRIRELPVAAESEVCVHCKTQKVCVYACVMTTNEGPPEPTEQFVCSFDCVQSLRNEFPGRFELVQKRVAIVPIFDFSAKCERCSQEKVCKFRYRSQADPSPEWRYLCDTKCVEYLTTINGQKYSVVRKKYTIEERLPPYPDGRRCIQCGDRKPCQFGFMQDEDELSVCNDCLNLLMTEHPDLYRLKRCAVRIRAMPKAGATNEQRSGALIKFTARTEEEAEAARLNRDASFVRRCFHCQLEMSLDSAERLQWETMDFCNAKCLAQYQNTNGSQCTQCRGAVSVASLGKYCVRFGFDVCQFCCAACLDVFKKGLKPCSYCQANVADGTGSSYIVTRVGDKGIFRDFCSAACHNLYRTSIDPALKLQVRVCSVCNYQKQASVIVRLDGREHYFCTMPCFSAFKFVNNVNPDGCAMCKDYFERTVSTARTIFSLDGASEPLAFCCKMCFNLHIIKNRRIVSCSWCKVKKYNFDMLQRPGLPAMLCSLNCLSLYDVSMNAIAKKETRCDHCLVVKAPQYHLTMSDTSLRNFCTYQCVMSFQSQFNKRPLVLGAGQDSTSQANPVPTGLPKRVRKPTVPAPVAQPAGGTPLPAQQQKQAQPQPQQQQVRNQPEQQQYRANSVRRPTRAAAAANSNLPVISSVHSLAVASGRGTRSKAANQGPATVCHNDWPRVALEPLTNLPPSGRPLVSNFLSSTPTTSADPSPLAVAVSATSTSTPSAVAATQPPAATRTVETHTQIVTIPPTPVQVGNVATMCAPIQSSKAVNCRPVQCSVDSQTDGWLQRKIVIPIPVPIYVPVPMFMYSMPTPVPVPIPLPIPVPVFIPTTRNSANGILKEIRKIQDKMPADPYEAELLMMAEMVAGDKKKDDTDSESDDGADVGEAAAVVGDVQTSPFVGAIENNASFSEDLVQMALKMASNDFVDPAEDLESAMHATTISQQQQEQQLQQQQQQQQQQHHAYVDGSHLQHQQLLQIQDQRQPMVPTLVQRGRKRTASAVPARQAAANNNSIQPQQQMADGTKRIKREQLKQEPSPEPAMAVVPPAEKPDANMCLKYTFGVNAWKQWVLTKNADLEKSSIRRKLFKSDILQLTADELNYSLCLFVKEVRKPNGTEYAPDTIYYLVLGIQQYLFEKGRVENIFTDPYYERFTDCLDEVAKKFSVLYNDSQFIVTRVEEEHLWECKQLGAHSPHVLLSTLMFFNTKHFNLVSVEEHMELSFSHIMKHWKRNPNQAGQGAKSQAPRNVMLRFYPPQSSLAANTRKKKVYEQQENEDNPLRCPVKLYEFYLSKCPESVKTRNDVFYLQPERSCVPDSPVWYSTQALSKESLCKMLHRVKMVKEINIALLTS
ncbi:zinc finger MYM-type protein 4 [Anopheles bellator]|uniref:zinc finger MYM-type protein 4 n=1 Tax=Anopheles bellator TaxID=139047 RepID=UPI00264A19DD|nr:zinc finger MYM-type protein 4 [Anopheles bellator]